MTDFVEPAALLPFVRPELARPAPYRWQEGIPTGRVARFDMNTLPVDPPYWAAIAAELARTPVSSYPDAAYGSLRAAYAAYAGVTPEQVVPGAGADEILQLSATLALGPGDVAVVAAPTYQLYAVATRVAGGLAERIEPVVEGDAVRLDLDAVAEAAPSARLVWLCSPNNPTGEEIPAGRVAEIAAACPGLVVLDQAYVELGGTDLSALVADHPNLVVARTLSKGFGLAALRVGFGIAQPALAGALDALRPPGSISLHSALGAERALGFVEEMRELAAAYVAERERLAGGFAELGLPILGQAATFVTVRTPWSGADAFARLAAERLAVRTFPSEPALSDVIRVCVATPAEDDALLTALARLLDRPEPAAVTQIRIETTPLFGRRGSVHRSTAETTIDLELGLDGTGRSSVSTGLGFLDHMLTALAFHGLLDLDLTCRGDLDVDEHHTVEDCAIALGQALDRALGDRRGIRRFADAAAPLDEAVARVVVDLGGRGGSTLALGLSGAAVGGIGASLWPHALDSFARAARATIHVDAAGTDDHHLIEATFKALALALRRAVELDPRRAGAVPSTKDAIE